MLSRWRSQQGKLQRPKTFHNIHCLQRLSGVKTCAAVIVLLYRSFKMPQYTMNSADGLTFVLLSMLFDRSAEQVQANIECNAVSAVHITHHFLKRMVGYGGSQPCLKAAAGHLLAAGHRAVACATNVSLVAGWWCLQQIICRAGPLQPSYAAHSRCSHPDL
jgi:NAD(P)-dependent dehydrogenase (short-subunit alcohol dehydrogenase family)